jgi:(p)ppGpp synthase/HD superfamily hydrolase
MFAEYVSKKNKQYYATSLIVTTILHDCIEDTKLTKAMIAEIFGESVASKVEDLTRIKADKKITAGETLELLYPKYKTDILYIKLFDRLHNIQTLGSMPPEKRQRIAQETMKYFVPLGSCLGLGDLTQELLNLTYQALSVPSHQVFANSSIFCCASLSLSASTLINCHKPQP